jgi:hypothetical protein
MELVTLDVQDGRGKIEVCVDGRKFEAERLREYFNAADKSFADADEHYQRGYDDAIKFISGEGK